ncbi:MAG: DNA-binding protein [Comamonadaceae bacterium]|nr:DNA-binding protein [Comamonadaceae bacterium]
MPQAITPPATRSAEEAAAQFRREGKSVAEWARNHGFNPRLVYQVLSGKRKCLRGVSFLIAEALRVR